MRKIKTKVSKFMGVRQGDILPDIPMLDEIKEYLSSGNDPFATAGVPSQNKEYFIDRIPMIPSELKIITVLKFLKQFENIGFPISHDMFYYKGAMCFRRKDGELVIRIRNLNVYIDNTIEVYAKSLNLKRVMIGELADSIRDAGGKTVLNPLSVTMVADSMIINDACGSYDNFKRELSRVVFDMCKNIDKTIIDKIVSDQVDKTTKIIKEWIYDRFKKKVEIDNPFKCLRACMYYVPKDKYSVDGDKYIYSVLMSAIIEPRDGRPLEIANTRLLYASDNDVMVRFDMNSEYVTTMVAKKHPSLPKVDANDISISNFDMVVPLPIIVLEHGVGGFIANVTIYDKDSEADFSNAVFDENGKCLLGSDLTYEELYSDLWSLNKKAVIMNFCGVKFVLNHNFEIKWWIIEDVNKTTQEDIMIYSFAVMGSLKALAYYLKTNINNGINITFHEKEVRQSSDKRKSAEVVYRKGCVVRAHFRHYKSGIVTFVKPHIRRGTDVVNGKVIIDIK